MDLALLMKCAVTLMRKHHRQPKHPGTKEKRRTLTAVGSRDLKLASGHTVIYPRVRGSFSAQARPRSVRLCCDI